MRLLLAVVALGALVAGGTAVAMWAHVGPPGTTWVHVAVVAPEAALLFNDTVHVDAATAFTALQATGLALETRDYPGMGTYVVSVAGHRAAGADGWIYEVQRDGTTVSGDRSAASFVLHKGDAVAWRWTSG